jgi:hypothetical protein
VPPGEMSQWIKDLAAGHRTFAHHLADRQSLTIQIGGMTAVSAHRRPRRCWAGRQLGFEIT